VVLSTQIFKSYQWKLKSFLRYLRWSILCLKGVQLSLVGVPTHWTLIIYNWFSRAQKFTKPIAFIFSWICWRKHNFIDSPPLRSLIYLTPHLSQTCCFDLCDLKVPRHISEAGKESWCLPESEVARRHSELVKNPWSPHDYPIIKTKANHCIYSQKSK